MRTLYYQVKDLLIFISKSVWTDLKGNIIELIRNTMADIQSGTVCFL